MKPGNFVLNASRLLWLFLFASRLFWHLLIALPLSSLSSETVNHNGAPYRIAISFNDDDGYDQYDLLRNGGRC